MICDYHLPDGNGLDILNYSRDDKNGNALNLKTDFVMVTGNNDMEIVKECITKGVSGYLVKPLQPAKFLQKCCKLLKIPVPKF